MKDGIVIKTMWLLLGGAAKASLPILGVSDPKPDVDNMTSF